jgi:23S rRNA maturation-related 3'-5' exoribonuclease YhaM
MEFDGEMVKVKDFNSIYEFEYKVRGDLIDLISVENGQRIIKEYKIEPDGSISRGPVRWIKK